MSQPLRPLQIRLRMRLPVGDVVRGNQNFRHRQSAMPQPILREQPGARGDNTPSPIRNRLHEIQSAGHHCDSALILRLMIFDRRRLRLSIKMRRYSADYLNRSHPMRDGHHRIAVDALARGPLPPLAVHLPRRIAKHPIQIKKNCSARKVSHSLLFVSQADVATPARHMWRQPPRLSKRRRSRAPLPQISAKNSACKPEFQNTPGALTHL